MSRKRARLPHIRNFGEKFTQKLNSFYINGLEKLKQDCPELVAVTPGP